MTSGYRPTKSGPYPKLQPPNKTTAGRKAETVYHVHWHGELPKQQSFGVIFGMKVHEMTTSVRLDGDLFVVRINGCQHRLNAEDAERLFDQLYDAIEDHQVIVHCREP